MFFGDRKTPNFISLGAILISLRNHLWRYQKADFLGKKSFKIVDKLEQLDVWIW